MTISTRFHVSERFVQRKPLQLRSVVIKGPYYMQGTLYVDSRELIQVTAFIDCT